MPGYGGYRDHEPIARAIARSVQQTPEEFMAAARDLARRRHTEPFDQAFGRIAGEERARKERLWQAAAAQLGQLVAAAAAEPVPAGAQALTPTYLREKLDPHHRAGFLLARCLTRYNQAKPPVPFFEWLDQLPELDRVNLLRRDFTPELEARRREVLERDGLGAMARAVGMPLRPSEVKMLVAGVKYLDEAGRQSYATPVAAGRLMQRGAFFDTGRMSTVHSGPGWAIFVQSAATGTFYSSSHVLGLFHHSSFLSGAPVRAAGEWRVQGGQLLEITAKSGHYQPTMAQFLNGLASLRQQGLDLSRAQALLFRARERVLVPAPELLARPADFRDLVVWG